MVGHRFCEALAELDVTDRYHVIVFGEEPRVAYDRVHLSAFFEGRSAEDLQLSSPSWYSEQGFELCTGDAVLSIDRVAREVVSESGRHVRYDALVLATGSAPFVPPIPGTDKRGVFVYRTIEDLEAMSAWAAQDSVALRQ